MAYIYQASFLKSASLHVIFIGGDVGRTQQKLSYSGKKRIQAISRTLQIEHAATLVLIPQPYDVRRVGFKESKPVPPLKPWLQDFIGSAKHIPSLEEGGMSLLHNLGEVLGHTSPQH